MSTALEIHRSLALGRSPANRFWSWILLAASGGALFVVGVELVNILFYDPQGADYFLFRTAGSLASLHISTLTWLMFGSLLVLLLMGLPLAFAAGGLGVVFIYLVGDQSMLTIIPSRIFPMMTSADLAAIPLFIFMAAMLERTGLIEEMFDVAYQWMGGLSGGLAAATILASTLLAAMMGGMGAAVVTMGVIALPAMLKRRYDPQIALGSIMAGGTLGILLPPSILAILYAAVAQQSVGELYLGAVVPGLLLSALYAGYVLLHTWLEPSLGPAIPAIERVTLWEKLLLLRRLLAPLMLVFIVLGSLFAGIATPAEAAGIGSLGAMVVALMHRRLSIGALREASITTVKASAMVLWIIFGASIFIGFYILQGGQEFITETLLGTGLSPYGLLLLMMVLLVVVGIFLDWVGVLLLVVPIFVPVIGALTFDGLFGLPPVPGDKVLLWFGMLCLVSMQMSLLSPPFGHALLYMQGICPRGITVATIFRSSLAFLGLQAVGLTICVLFPGMALWLPSLVYG